MDSTRLHPSPREETAARNEARLHLLIETGLLLASQEEPRRIVEVALEAGRALTGADFGACFYNPVPVTSPTGEVLFAEVAFSGREAPTSVGAGSATPSPTSLFGRPLRDEGIVRSDDLPADAPPSPALAPSATSPSVGSYLAVPIRTQAGRWLGSLVYSHENSGAFGPEHEGLLTPVAAQAALALDHALLHGSLRAEVRIATEARLAEREATRRLAQALQAAQLGTWSWKAKSSLVDFDERGAALLGVEPNVGLARNELRTRLVNREDLHRTPADLRSVLNGGGSYTAEYRVLGPDGTDRWICATGDAVHDSAGRPVGMIGTLQDISSRKLQEESLRTSEKLAATGRLAATIAHEINNPLEAVTNLIYLAKTDPITPPSVSRLLETADNELARVSQIAQQTLGFYRDTTQPASVDLNSLLKAIVDLFERKLTGKRIQCTLDLEPGLYVVGLQGELRQVVSNLLVNAIDASLTAGSNIRIRARHRRRDGNHGVSLLVSDQGSGIPHHVRPRLFTPFTTTKQSLGTGLGLWVTQGMVEKHGGSVRFRSRITDPSGTVFRVFLPASGSPQLFAQQSNPVLQ